MIVGEYDINKNQHHDIDLKFSEVPLIYYYKNGNIEKPNSILNIIPETDA